MAETTTQTGLAGLASQMPVRNRTIADQQRAGRLLQLQQAVAGMTPQQAPTTAQAAGMGATMAAQAGQQMVQGAQQAVQQTGQLAKLGQAETELGAAQRVSALQTGAQQEQLDQTARLAKLDDSAKREMFDSALQFKKDQADNALFTERQLADYARSNAQRDEDYKNWAQRASQLHTRNLQVLETINARLEEAIQQEYRTGKQKMDQAAIVELGQMKRDNDIRIAKARAKAANTAAMWGAVGGVAMMGGTALVATGIGAPAGAGLIAAGGAASYYGQQQAAKEGGNV